MQEEFKYALQQDARLTISLLDMGAYIGNRHLDAEMEIDLERDVIRMDYTHAKFQVDLGDSNESYFDFDDPELYEVPVLLEIASINSRGASIKIRIETDWCFTDGKELRKSATENTQPIRATEDYTEPKLQ